MRVGFVQFSPERGAGPENIDRAGDLIGSQAADLWVLPEMVTSGYLFRDRDELFTWAESVPNGRSIQRLQELAGRLNSAFVAGFPELSDDNIYNSAIAISATGDVVGIYRKIHLFYLEKSAFTPGDKPPQVWEIGGAQVGIMICYDWIYPETARSLALQGADIIAHPANLVLPHAPQAMRTRSIENRVFTITSNRIGDEAIDNQQFHFIGQSIVYAPHGKCLLSASDEESVALVTEIDLSMARNKQITSNNHLWQDRRPEMYHK